MFLDTKFDGPRSEEPPRPRPRSTRDKVLSRLLLAWAFLLLFLPISLGSAVDVVRALLALIE